MKLRRHQKLNFIVRGEKITSVDKMICICLVFAEPLPSSNCLLSYASNLRPDPSCLVTQNASVPMSMPENTASTSSQDCCDELEEPEGRHSDSAAAAPRSILKRMSTSSSTDSLSSYLDLQSPAGLDPPAETSMDRRQVRFSNMVSHIAEEWQDGKELGEHGLLDVDTVVSSEMENCDLNNHDLEESDRRTTDDHELILSENGADAQESEPSCKNEAEFKEPEAEQQQVLSGKKPMSQIINSTTNQQIKLSDQCLLSDSYALRQNIFHFHSSYCMFFHLYFILWWIKQHIFFLLLWGFIALSVCIRACICTFLCASFFKLSYLLLDFFIGLLYHWKMKYEDGCLQYCVIYYMQNPRVRHFHFFPHILAFKNLQEVVLIQLHLTITHQEKSHTTNFTILCV